VLRLAADENFNSNIVRGLLRRKPDLDIVRIQDVGLSGADDPSVLEWAARQGRVLVSHDVSTLTKHAYERVATRQRMPGVFEVSTNLAVGNVIDDLLLIVECSLEGEWEGQVRYLPL
jgi:predicted nuclease of predicted toxin-antitoxin system